MKGIDVAELKAIQIDVLQAIHDFCRDNGIIYSLACGSALGAVRHHGYIPWDDDIDIYLLRDDYNRLIKKYINEGNYRIISMESDKEWDKPFAKAYDARTVFIEQANCGKTIGVGIDVYPIDIVPEDEIEWRRFNLKRRRLQRILSIKQIQYDRSRPFIKNCYLLMGKLVLLPFTRYFIAKYINNFIQRYNSKGGQWVFECAQGMIQKNRFHKKVFERTIPVKFENREFMLFENYDEYLRNGYGDYMKLPPKEKQIPHHVFTAYWK